MGSDIKQTEPDFLLTWISEQDHEKTYTGFDHNYLVEDQANRDKVLPALAETVFYYHNDPEDYRSELENLGFERVVDSIEMRPQSLNTRKGNFGEILAREYLKCFQDFEIPVYRLRYNPNPESSMKGDDVLAFKFNDDEKIPNEIFVGEAKVRTQFSSRVVSEAYEQLSSSYAPKPVLIPFVVRVLKNQGRNDEAERILNLFDRFTQLKPKKNRLLFLVTGNNPMDPFGCLSGEQVALDNLTAVNISFVDLDDLVTNCFEFDLVIHDE